jgi:ribosomal protein S18 acetylase RimI-like enzyme
MSRVSSFLSLQGTAQSLQQLLSSTGLNPADTAVAVKYVGIDYEYRGQGIGQQLVSLMQEVATEAR